jgi:hypothetical protein
MRPRTWKTLLGGLAASGVMTLLMKKAVPLTGLPPMHPDKALGQYFGGRRDAGMAAHFFAGTALFPMLYSTYAFDVLPGPAPAKGLLYGAALWLFSQTAVGPAMGHGWFSEHAGGARASAASLGVHVAYGGVLATVASYGDERRRLQARQRWLGQAA